MQISRKQVNSQTHKSLNDKYVMKKRPTGYPWVGGTLKDFEDF